MPRYNIDLESETQGEFVVNAGISKWYGVPWPKLNTPDEAPSVVFSINLVSNNDVLVSNTVSVGTTGTVFSFNFANIKPSFDPYKVVLFGATPSAAPNVTAESEFFYLPEKTDGSVTKLDNLYGGFMFRNSKTQHQFEPLLPYGFYASCDGFLCEDDNRKQIKAYQDLGLNAMVALTPITDSKPAFEYMDSIDMKYMYDLRGYFKNLTAVRDQVSEIKDFDSLYSYWGTDE
jgi:hypothetical protein